MPPGCACGTSYSWAFLVEWAAAPTLLLKGSAEPQRMQWDFDESDGDTAAWAAFVVGLDDQQPLSEIYLQPMPWRACCASSVWLCALCKSGFVHYATDDLGPVRSSIACFAVEGFS